MKKNYLNLLLLCAASAIIAPNNSSSTTAEVADTPWYRFNSKQVLQTIVISALTVVGGCMAKSLRNRCTARRINKKIREMNITNILEHIKNQTKVQIKQSDHTGTVEFRDLGDTSDSSSCAGKYVIAEGRRALTLLQLDDRAIAALKQSRGVILFSVYSRHPRHQESCVDHEIEVAKLLEILQFLCYNHIPHITINLRENAIFAGPGNCSGKVILPQFSLVTMFVPGTTPAERTSILIPHPYNQKKLEPEIDKILSYKVSRWILERAGHHESKAEIQTDYNQAQNTAQLKKLSALLPYTQEVLIGVI
jgi:hypothetical protein